MDLDSSTWLIESRFGSCFRVVHSNRDCLNILSRSGLKQKWAINHEWRYIDLNFCVSQHWNSRPNNIIGASVSFYTVPLVSEKALPKAVSFEQSGLIPLICWIWLCSVRINSTRPVCWTELMLGSWWEGRFLSTELEYRNTCAHTQYRSSQPFWMEIKALVRDDGEGEMEN